MIRATLGLLAFAALAISGPATAAAPAVTMPAPVTAAPSPLPAATAAAAIASDDDNDYHLGSGDKVSIRVFNEDTLSGEFSVSSTGKLSLPLIGDVDAQGHTPMELVQIIQGKLADGYLKDPRVSIDVLTYRPFYIMGEINKPGEYPYSSGLTVINAVARAEGFTYRANKGKVFIKRAGESTEHVVDLSPDIRVNPGDTIRIGERYF